MGPHQGPRQVLQQNQPIRTNLITHKEIEYNISPQTSPLLYGKFHIQSELVGVCLSLSEFEFMVTCISGQQPTVISQMFLKGLLTV